MVQNLYYDELETRDPETREAALFAALPKLVEKAQQDSPAFARMLAGIDFRDITGRAALTGVPILRKSDVPELQRLRPPLGGLNTVATGDMVRLFASPGPIYEPEFAVSDYWGMARALFVAGFRRGDLIHNCFSYHFTPAGSMVESGARALGCTVFPGGVGNTEGQISAIAQLRPQGYAGTPSFLRIILDKGREKGEDLSSLTKALVSGEALPPSLRTHIRDYGIDPIECYAIADIGVIAYQSRAREGLIVDERVIVEIVRPGTGEPVPDGEVGEVVVTSFNHGYPLIRFATGDLSAVLPGRSPCGRTNMRIVGWLGRVDQTTKVKGMFIHPVQLGDALKRHPQVRKGRLVVDREGLNDSTSLLCEVEGGDEDLAGAISESVQAVCKVHCQVVLTALGSLPNDGKIIEDRRTHY
jgi:phenylacetate-coenzyme A ligase PaaK-like adenylate-forming protein